MYGNYKKIDAFFQGIQEYPAPLVQNILALPAPYLAYTHEKIRHSALGETYALAGQRCSPHDQGAYTGAVSAAMLKDVGCQYVIVGHPENRHEESFQQRCQILARAREQALGIIMCLVSLEDASLMQREISITDLCAQEMSPLMLAYEPCVGTDTLPQNLAQDAKILKEMFPAHPVLYGGGVNPETLAQVAPHFHGFLVGRASLDPQRWCAMASAVENLFKPR